VNFPRTDFARTRGGSRPRSHVVVGVAIVVLVCLTVVGAAELRAPFGFENVAEVAKKLASESFKPRRAIPDFLRRLGYDEYRDIRFDPAQSLWKGGRGNFQVQFMHPGQLYDAAVAINTLDASGVHPVSFSPKLFSYGGKIPVDKIPADLGFAGFQITYPLYTRAEYNHVLVFAGASYFRGVAKNQAFGLSVRGLALDTGLPSGEEFPFFREFWLQQPAREAHFMKLYALLDSQSVTGAYEFVVRPGERTLVDVRARLFERKRAKEIGIAPLTSMFFYGEERPRPGRDWRPEVHDSDGLLIHSGTGEWIWRPLVNPGQLGLSYFDVENPRGFGLLQRDRNFPHYEDLEARYDTRPSTWITPLDKWGQGQIKLVEIPTPREFNDNIVAYWIPKILPSVGQPIDVRYRMHFQSDDPLEPSSGRATATRVGSGDADGTSRIVVDFEGGKLKSLPQTAAVVATITVAKPGELIQQNVFKNAVTGGWRVAFQLKPPKDKPLEVRAFLQHGTDVITETWSYLLAP
jgi:glucans biosynthesis protein